MNQTLRASSIRFHEPVSTPAPLPAPQSPQLIADHRPDGHVVEALRCTVGDDDPQWIRTFYANRWLLVERDPLRNVIRESTASYASQGAAYGAYWYAGEDDPLEWEAWISPLFASSAKIVTNHIYPPIPDRSMDWCAYYDGEEERGNYGYGRTEQAAIDDLIANSEAA